MKKKGWENPNPRTTYSIAAIICSYDVVPSAVFCVYAWQFFSAVFSLQNPCFLFLRLVLLNDALKTTRNNDNTLSYRLIANFQPKR